MQIQQLKNSFQREQLVLQTDHRERCTEALQVYTLSLSPNDVKLNGAASGNEDDKNNKKQHQHEKDLHDKPAIGRDAIQVFQQLSLGRVNICQGVVNILVNANCHLPLLLYL